MLSSRTPCETAQTPKPSKLHRNTYRDKKSGNPISKSPRALCVQPSGAESLAYRHLQPCQTSPLRHHLRQPVPRLLQVQLPFHRPQHIVADQPFIPQSDDRPPLRLHRTLGHHQHLPQSLLPMPSIPPIIPLALRHPIFISLPPIV